MPAEPVDLGGMAMTEGWLLWGLLFGSIGFVYFLYGKKQRSTVPLLCGLALMVFPYLIQSTILLVVIGTVLTAVPYFVRL